MRKRKIKKEETVDTSSRTFELCFYDVVGFVSVSVEYVANMECDWRITTYKVRTDRGSTYIGKQSYRLWSKGECTNEGSGKSVHGYMQTYLIEILNSHLVQFNRVPIVVDVETPEDYSSTLTPMIAGLLIFQGGYERIKHLMKGDQYKDLRKVLQKLDESIDRARSRIAHGNNGEPIILSNCIGTYFLVDTILDLPVDLHEGVARELGELSKTLDGGVDELSHLSVEDALKYMEELDLDRMPGYYMNMLDRLEKERKFTIYQAKRFLKLKDNILKLC